MAHFAVVQLLVGGSGGSGERGLGEGKKVTRSPVGQSQQSGFHFAVLHH